MNISTRINIFSIGLLLLTVISTQAQNPPSEFDAEKYDPPYTLTVPQGWGVERFAIPIEFAPSIPYKGVEDVRFTPGWGDAKSDQYWSYAFLWYLEGKTETNAQIIEKNLTAYYSGLVGRNIERRKIPKEKLMPVKVIMKKVTATDGDLQTYTGTINMLDYMEQKPMTLNCTVHIKSCPSPNSTFIFYEISPKPSTDNVWKEFQKLSASFVCNKTSSK